MRSTKTRIVNYLLSKKEDEEYEEIEKLTKILEITREEALKAIKESKNDEHNTLSLTPLKNFEELAIALYNIKEVES